MIVAWADEPSDEVRARLFTSLGVPIGPEFVVNTAGTGDPKHIEVTTLSGGNVVVSWVVAGLDGSGDAVAARVFDSGGVAISAQFTVNQTIILNQSQPSITATADGGFLVAWHSQYNINTNSTLDHQVYGRHFSSSGVATTAEFLLGTSLASAHDSPTVVSLQNGLIVASWDSSTADGSAKGIVQRVFALPGNTVQIPASPLLDAIDPVVTTTEAALSSAQGVFLEASGAAVVSDADSTEFDGGKLTVARVSEARSSPGAERAFDLTISAGMDVFAVHNEGQSAGQIGVSGSAVTYGGVSIGTFAGGANGVPLVVSFNAQATPDAVERLIENLVYRNASNDPDPRVDVGLVLEDDDGGTSDVKIIAVNITSEGDGPQRVGTYAQVNTVTQGSQSQPDVAALDDGGWVVVWSTAGLDGVANTTTGISGQRYAADGSPVGGEFALN